MTNFLKAGVVVGSSFEPIASPFSYTAPSKLLVLF